MKPEGRIQSEAAAIASERNVMPSMVVRQQRIHHQMGAASANQNLASAPRHHQHGSLAQKPPPPPPPTTTTAQLRCQDPHLGQAHDSSLPASQLAPPAAKELGKSNLAQHCLFDQDGLVLPKRVLHNNPIGLSEAQPIIRDLNRELKFNQIRGKNVLDQKSELKKALERLEENKRRKEAEQERLSRRTSLELRLEERAERLARQTGAGTIKTSPNSSSSASANTMSNSAANAANPLTNFSIKPITR